MTQPDSVRPRAPLTRLLAVEPGTPHRHENLTIFPLLAKRQPDLPYLLLGDALDLGVLSIGELGSGSVPSLVATNKGDLDVLLLDGEQLIGAKQNRITNRTIILAAMTETKSFREDLLYRLSVVRLVVPPLRDRVEDVPVLAARFVTAQALEPGMLLLLDCSVLDALGRVVNVQARDGLFEIRVAFEGVAVKQRQGGFVRTRA